jgi:hypothetical protein
MPAKSAIKLKQGGSITDRPAVPLLCLSLFTKYDLRPKIRVFGVPFLATVWEYKGNNWISSAHSRFPRSQDGTAFFLLPQVLMAAGM